MIFTKSLKGRHIFKLMFKKGKYVSKDYITLYVLKNNLEENTNYLGICVSKKHGNSVNRNRIKRWAKEAYKEIEMNIKSGYNIIILYKKNIETSKMNYKIIKEEIEYCMKEQGMYINE